MLDEPSSQRASSTAVQPARLPNLCRAVLYGCHRVEFCGGECAGQCVVGEGGISVLEI